MQDDKPRFVSAQIPDDLLTRLEEFCSTNMLNRSAVIRKAIQEYLDREEK